MSRSRLPFRHHGITQRVSFKNHSFDVTFGVGDSGSVQEAFMRSTKEGADLSDLLRDGCILLSLLLQHGEPAAAIAEALGENRGEGETSGPESSAIGSIARAAAALDVQLSAVVDGVPK